MAATMLKTQDTVSAAAPASRPTAFRPRIIRGYSGKNASPLPTM
jgi:hypothetical protein